MLAKGIAPGLEPTAKFGGKKGHMPSLFSELRNVSPKIGINPDLVLDITSLQTQFSNWNVSQRYASQTTFVLQAVLDEQTGSRQAHLLMTNCLQGLI